MKSQADIFYQAVLSRDSRFDGKFFIGVKTTGIYCRPICPAKPKRQNVEFFLSRHLAEKAGYRPCLRCRPESAPLSPVWIGKSAVIGRAMKLISGGKILEFDENDFAELLGVSARHLRRLFDEEFGKTPKQISDEMRLDLARKLIVETALPITEIAFGSGFASIRRFNDAVKKRFQRAPRELRKSGGQISLDETGITLRLSYRPPLDWKTLLHSYRTHEVVGVETVHDDIYERRFRILGIVGAFQVYPSKTKTDSSLCLRVIAPEAKVIFPVVQRVRQMFDLDSDPLLIANALSESEPWSHFSTRYPGLRIPRGWDPFESSVCVILGQLVSVDQGRRFAAQAAFHYGDQIRNPLTGETCYLFPEPERLARESLSEIGITQKRKQAIQEFSRLVLEKKLLLDATQDMLELKKVLLSIPGIGPWTAEYIGLRALGDTDAFPETDLILKRALELHPKATLDRLKPWRSYAAIYLWKHYAGVLSKIRRRKEP